MIHALVHDNLSFIAAVAIGSIAFLALALIVERFARGASAASRHTILLAAMLVPVLLILAAAIPSPVAPQAASIEATITGALAPVAAAEKPSELPCILVGLWALGALITFVRSARSALHWRGVKQFADAKSGFAVSHEVSEPMVIGIVRPTIVLPAGEYMESLTLPELETVFVHEQAHIARRDNLVALFVQIACALFWFDPLHLIARRRLVALRERACDEAVLERGCDADSYLTALARSCEVTFRTSAVASMSRLQLRERMESIMTYETRRHTPDWIVRIAVAGAIALAAVAFTTLAPTPTLTAGEVVTAPPENTGQVVTAPPENTGESFDFDVYVMRGKKNPFMVSVRSAVFTGVVEFSNAPETQTVATTAGGRTWKWTIQLNADGSGIATLDVRDGATLVATSARTLIAPPSAKRVGDDPNMKPPVAMTRVEPVYPAEAKANRISGIVILELVIKEDGTVGEARVLKPLPYGLDQAAVDAVRQWQFKPATIDGKPVAVVFNITINFKLDEESKG